MASGVPLKTKVQGIVKAVISGDTVILVKPGVPKSGPPPEVRLSLSSLKAPALKPPLHAATAPDEPYAWAAREFLRKKLVGKTVMFVVEYVVTQTNRARGTIFVAGEGGEAVSISKEILQKGLATVRRPNNPKEDRSFEYEDLCAIEDEAKEEKIGLHAPGDMPEKLGRVIMETPDTLEYMKKVRGKTLTGIVDYVLNGSAMKILIPEDEKPGSYRFLTVCLSGVQAPGFRRAEGKPAEEGAPPPPLVAMPFALNAKFFTESTLLHRDVEVTFEGADKVGNLYAKVTPLGSSLRIAEELLRKGLAKTFGWSMEFTSDSAQLRAAEKGARDARLGTWHDYVPNPNAAVASTDVFSGRVVEVVSGDILAIASDVSGEIRRVSFASIRSPKLGRGGEKDMPGAWEAREYLRSRLIGRRVKVSVDYQRKPQSDSNFKETMIFATITREKGGKENAEDDVGAGLVRGGYVAVVRHRSDEERARNYEEYVQLEKDAITAKRGIHSDKPQDVRRVNDLTGPENKKRSKEMLDSFASAGPMKGILEYASTGSRFRIFLSKGSALIGLALKGVRSPVPSRTNIGQDGSKQAGMPFGDEALHYVKLSFLQRDVIVNISSVDRTGAYLGTVQVDKQTVDGSPVDIGLNLLENGYATLNEFFDPSRDDGGENYVRAQVAAKAADKGLWKELNPLEVAAAAKETKERGDDGKVVRGKVVELGFGGRLFIHREQGTDESLRSVESALSNLSVSSELPVATLKSNELFAARFSLDGLWYRSKVLRVDADAKMARVRFVDYGNDEWVPFNSITRLPGTVSSVPKLATEVTLLHVVVPSEGEELCMEAGQALRQITFGKTVEAQIAHRDSNGVPLAIVTADGVDVGAELLRSGLARLLRQRSRASKEAFAKYAKDEEQGRQKHQNLWRFGDPYASDEDDTEADKEARERRYGGVPRR